MIQEHKLEEIKFERETGIHLDKIREDMETKDSIVTRIDETMEILHEWMCQKEMGLIKKYDKEIAVINDKFLVPGLVGDEPNDKYYTLADFLKDFQEAR